MSLIEVLIALAIVSVALTAGLRALGLSASGSQAMHERSLALLAALSDEEVENVLRRNATRLAPYPSVTVGALREAVSDARQRGYAFNPGHLLKGMYGIGVTIFLARQPVAALSVAAHYGRMDADRRRQIAEHLRHEAADVCRLQLQ